MYLFIGVVDNLMAYRLWKYTLLLAEKHLKDKGKLPLIFPIVVTQTIKDLSESIIFEFKNTFINPILPINNFGYKTPVFIIHPAGGVAFPYIKLREYLDRNIPIYGINNPNFNSSNKNLNNIENIAEHYIKVIKEVQKTGPYILSGWSLGGIIALEMAQKLKQQHEYVKKVIVIDSDILNIKDSINHDDEIIINQFNDLDLEAQKVFALNLKHADILIKKYHFKPYNGEIILLRTKKSELFWRSKHKSPQVNQNALYTLYL